MGDDRIHKTEDEWRQELGAEQFHVCREHGTERPFTGAYHAEKGEGTYLCSCCGEPLFDSDTKYESGTGWPSFYAPLSDASVETSEDRSHGMHRTEVHCRRCGAHLGHVFPDGPQPTGMRYCINSVSLKMKRRTSGTGED